MSSAATSAAPSATTDRRRWKALGFLAFGLAMIVLDGTIVGIALPAIIADLKLDLTDAQWVNSVYAVVFAALLLTSGRLGDRRGRRTLFVIGVVIFAGASVAAALAHSAGALIASRAAQGVGGAMVLPSSLATVNATFQGRDRAAAFGVWGAVMAGAAAVGPLLGGWLTQAFDWRWIFVVNVPIAIVVVIGVLMFADETRARVEAPGLDVDGLLTSALGFGLLVFGLIEGSALGWWTARAPLTVLGWTWPWQISAAPVAIALGALFLVLFVLWERHRAGNGRSAVLDLRLFSIRTFTWGNVTAGAVAVGEFALVFALPLYLVNVLDLDILQAGVVLAVMALGAFVAGAQARHIAARFTPQTVVVIGLLLEVSGVVVLAIVLGPDTSPVLLSVLLLVYGLGLGLASAQLTSIVLADVPADRSGTGSATQSTVRQVGSALGSAVAGSVLATRLATDLPAALAAQGLPTAQIDRLSRATIDSAGGAIAGVRAQSAAGAFGPAGDGIVQALTSGFAHSTTWAIAAAAVFLGLGLIGALRVARHATAAHAVTSTAAATAAPATDAVAQPQPDAH